MTAMNVDDWVRILALKEHPEGGWFRETWRSPIAVRTSDPDASRPSSTAIYYLLGRGGFSAFHRLIFDEVWHHYEGAPVEIHILSACGTHEVRLLGHDYAAGQRPQCAVPAHCWQGARVVGQGVALCGCTMGPGFDFSDFELASRPALTAQYPQHQALIASLTRA
jgi:uncharacterized protein